MTDIQIQSDTGLTTLQIGRGHPLSQYVRNMLYAWPRTPLHEQPMRVRRNSQATQTVLRALIDHAIDTADSFQRVISHEFHDTI